MKRVLLRALNLRIEHDGPRHTRVMRGNDGIEWYAKGTSSGVERNVHLFLFARRDFRVQWWRAG